MKQEQSAVERKGVQEGDRHGRLVAIERVGQDRWKAALWRFHCDCGNRKYVARPDQVRRGIIISCGCHRNEKHAERMRSMATHGATRNGKQTSEYVSWRNMHDRCSNPAVPNYARYGGRGITVCERWSEFRDFFYDMGTKPSARYTIDRIDSNGNYEPDNCRWDTPKQQGRNKTNNHIVIYAGREMSLAEACERSGVARNVVDARLNRGWTAEKALSTPVKYHRPRSG